MEMEAYNPPIEGRGKMLRLDFNENTVGCSPKVIKALQRVTAAKLAMYPEYVKFKTLLAKNLGIKKNQLLLTNATDEAIKLIIDTFIERGDEAILPTPTFAMFKFYLSLREADVKEVLYNEDLSFPINKILNTISDKTKLVILVSPNNPTGTKIDRENIIKIVEKAKNAIVLIDEAYKEYLDESAVDLIERYENLVVVQTFSKAYGLAGLRLGYIISCDENIEYLQKANSPYSVNTLAMVAAEAALEDKEFVDSYVNEVSKSKSMLIKKLSELEIKTFPSYANFLVADFGVGCERIYRQLRNRGILVRNRSNYPLLKNCLRIGIGTIEQTQRFLREIENIIRPQAILFDMDGVLVDVSGSYRVAIKQTVESFGAKTSFEEIQQYKEKTGYNNDWDLTETILTAKGLKAPKQKIIDRFQQYYLGDDFNGLIKNEKWLLNKETLKQLSKKYKLGIVTGRLRQEAMFALRDMSGYFSAIICMEDVTNGKPDPEPITRTLNQLGVKSAVYFGDSIDDVKAAVAAGIEAIGILPPDYKGKILKKKMIKDKTSCILNNINQLSEVLL